MTVYNAYVTLNNNSVQVQVNANLNSVRKVFSVVDYGAVGDGSTDDTTAVQNALNAAKSAGGGEVLFPPGTYFTSTGWNITVTVDTSLPIVLRGLNAQLKTNSAVPLLTLQNTGSGNLRRITVKDLSFNANNAGATGIKTRNAAYCFFQNPDFLGGGTAMDIGAGTAADLGLQGAALRFTGVGRAILLNATRCVFTNIEVSEGIVGPDVFNISGSGNVIDGFNALASGGAAGTAGIVLTNAATACIVANGNLWSSYTDGVFVGSGRYNQVVGVHIDNPQGHGLVVNGALQFRGDVTIQNASSSGVGNANGVQIVNTVTDSTIIASFVGTNALFDFNEASGSPVNNVYIGHSSPNGNTIASSSTVLFSAAGNRLVPSGASLGLFGSAGTTKASITGALSTVTDAAAKAVLTSIITALSGYGQVTNGTT